ncbi:hypothetical protein Q9966_001613 [Columba livia]|nr:hypothetical protein Q9966_001613 [Columba livia]
METYSVLISYGVCNLLNLAAIYANNEINLGNIEIYGFDYDYTLAQYPNLLHSMIFNTARDILIEKFKYPEGLGKYDYIPYLGTAYRGLKPVPDEEVTELYGGMQHIPLYQMSDFYGKDPSLKQFMDIFSLPEMTLLSSVIDYFITYGTEFGQVHLYKDISDAIRDVYVKGVMYKWIEKDLEQYILHGDEIYAVLNRLVIHKKKLFLILISIDRNMDKFSPLIILGL